MREDYARAKKNGDRAVRKAVSEGRYPYLSSLEHILPSFDKLPKRPLGVHEIPLARVVGTLTEGRQNAFACNFMPVLAANSEFGDKWNRLFDAQKNEGIRDAIKCYEYMHRFYVQEGNKRVSVLKSIGAYAIVADVQRIMPPRSDDPEVTAYYEFLDFYQVTDLLDICLTHVGDYEKLAKFYGQTLAEPWPEDVVLALRSDYRVFSKHYLARVGEEQEFIAGNAFLLYITIYGKNSIMEDSAASISRKIANIREELQTQTGEEGIAIVEKPDEGGHAANPLSGFFGKSYTKEHPLRVAFIYPGDAENSRWVYAHELGRNELNETYGGLVDAQAFFNCDTDEKVDMAIAAAAADEDEVIFTTSPAMMDASVRAAVQYPSMKILNCSINLSSTAVRTYYPRMYEAKYLMGMLAASAAEDHRIGYVSDYPLNGTIANINAFAIGAAVIDPRAKIYLKWSGEKDTSWERELKEAGIRVISGPDFIVPSAASRQYGVYCVGEDGAIRNIAAPMGHWGRFYSEVIQTIMDRTWNDREKVARTHAVNYWFGLPSGAIDVILSKDLPYYSRKLTKIAREGLLNGTIHPFRGELHSQSGLIAREGASALTTEEIIRMNWLNDNVIGQIPKRERLVDAVQSTVGKSGVIVPAKQQEAED